MVPNIRLPQDSYFPQRQSESDTKPVRGVGGRVESDLRTSASAPIPTKEQVTQAAARIKDVLRETTSRLEIEIDSDVHEVVVKILNGESGEVIRQIPAQELLDLAKYLDGPKGLLVSERA